MLVISSEIRCYARICCELCCIGKVDCIILLNLSFIRLAYMYVHARSNDRHKLTSDARGGKNIVVNGSDARARQAR